MAARSSTTAAARVASVSRRPSTRSSLGRLRARYPRSRRLRKRRDFLRVQDKSARVTTSHFVLLLAPRPSRGPCRLGVVASKKIGGAVVRNRAKRLLREVFRTTPGSFPDDIDLVVIARLGSAALSYAAVAREVQGVQSLLQRRAREVLRGHDPGLSSASDRVAKPHGPPREIASK